MLELFPIPATELVVFFSQFNALYGAGIPLAPAIKLAGEASGSRVCMNDALIMNVSIREG